MEASNTQPAPNVELYHRQISVGDSSIHVVEAGDPTADPIVFLHGWPESWRSWQSVIELASAKMRAIAVDLPGIGESSGNATDGTKVQIARVVHEVVGALNLENVTLVGQDVGGMIAYPYAWAYDLARVVIADVVIPGLGPWEQVLANPYLWHFAFHSIPDLPETLVAGHQAEYFDFFYDSITADPTKLTAAARSAYVTAYSTPSALTAGFNWYRTFPLDAEHNRLPHAEPMETPLLYLRGEHEGGDIAAYVDGFAAAGVTHIEHATVSGSGHFTQEEAPDVLWRLIADFIESPARDSKS